MRPARLRKRRVVRRSFRSQSPGRAGQNNHYRRRPDRSTPRDRDSYSGERRRFDPAVIADPSLKTRSFLRATANSSNARTITVHSRCDFGEHIGGLSARRRGACTVSRSSVARWHSSMTRAIIEVRVHRRRQRTQPVMPLLWTSDDPQTQNLALAGGEHRRVPLRPLRRLHQTTCGDAE